MGARIGAVSRDLVGEGCSNETLCCSVAKMKRSGPGSQHWCSACSMTGEAAGATTGSRAMLRILHEKGRCQ